MYKTSALKCGKCPNFSNGICKLTERNHGVNDNCDVNSDEKEIRSGKVKDQKILISRG